MSSTAAEHVLESLTYLAKKRKQVKKYWKKVKKLIKEEAEVDVPEKTNDRAHRVGPKRKKIKLS